MRNPVDRRYTERHQWIAVNSPHRVGITAFAAEQLGEVTYLELPDVGEQLEEDEAFGLIESLKAVSDLFAPVSGKVLAVNETAIQEPAVVGDDPYGEGWLLVLDPAGDARIATLLDAAGYAERAG